MKPDNGYYNPEKDYFQKVNLSLSCYLVRPVHRHGCFSKVSLPLPCFSWLTLYAYQIILVESPFVLLSGNW